MSKQSVWLSWVRVLSACLLVTLTSCAGGNATPCPHSCPATYLGVTLVVTGAMQGVSLGGVEATLSGPAMNTMSCEPNGTTTLCTWGSGPVTAGDYSLLVTAAGFQPATAAATITVSSPMCGCTFATMQPSTITLDPS